MAEFFGDISIRLHYFYSVMVGSKFHAIRCKLRGKMRPRTKAVSLHIYTTLDAPMI